MSDIIVSGSVVAWYAAIVATVSLLISAYNAWRDRARVVIQYGFNYKILDPVDPGRESKDYFKTTVINKGQRPVKITHVGAKFYGNSKTMLFNSSFHKDNEQRILTENNPSTDYLTDQSGLKLNKLWYVYAIDARGREYRKYSNALGILKFWWTRFVKNLSLKQNKN